MFRKAAICRAVTVEYKDPSGRKFSQTYQHAIHSTIGRTAPPAGMSAVTVAEAPSLVAEDLLLRFVKDLQATAAAAVAKST